MSATTWLRSIGGFFHLYAQFATIKNIHKIKWKLLNYCWYKIVKYVSFIHTLYSIMQNYKVGKLWKTLNINTQLSILTILQNYRKTSTKKYIFSNLQAYVWNFT